MKNRNGTKLYIHTLLIITGAGASHDVADHREINVRSEFQPPLTNYLFTGGGGQLIGSVNRFLIANPIAAQVGKDWRISRHSLEEYLLDLKNSKSLMLRKRYWSVPIYLHDLFLSISNSYINSASPGVPSNYSSLITAIAKNGNYGQIIWLNLNYDLLADSAIKASTNNELKTFDDYMNLETPDKIKIKYTKPHGSADWFKRDKAEIPWYDIRHGNVPDDFEMLLSEEIYTENMAHVGGLTNKETHRYPAILAPLGKHEYLCKDHIGIITNELKLIKSLSLLCIGFSALDQDILDLIKDNVKHIGKFKVVNKNYEEAKKAYLNIVRHYGNINVAMEQAIFNAGFTEFIKEGLDEWLS